LVGHAFRQLVEVVMPSRREVLAQLAGAAATCGVAKASGPPRRIGWLTAQQPGSLTPYLAALRLGLAEQRLPEGEGVEILYRYGNDDIRRVPDLARELVGGGAELLIVQGAAIPEALKLGLRVPIVFVTSADPVAAGFARSLTEPLGNWTGVTFMGFEFLGKRLEFLKEILPTLSYATVMGNPLHPGSDTELSSSESAGRRLGIAVDFIATPSRDSLENARLTLARSRPHAISLLPDGFALVHRKAIMDIAAELKIPVTSGWPIFAQAGALCTYGPQLPQIYRRVAHFVARILAGTKAADLPIERPSQFELILNQATARTFGVRFPRAMIARADEVIE
jgi:putative tryptophan/tyrosine transport system substrate-binding protein